jgi:hypothetical protein
MFEMVDPDNVTMPPASIPKMSPLPPDTPVIVEFVNVTAPAAFTPRFPPLSVTAVRDTKPVLELGITVDPAKPFTVTRVCCTIW